MTFDPNSDHLLDEHDKDDGVLVPGVLNVRSFHDTVGSLDEWPVVLPIPWVAPPKLW